MMVLKRCLLKFGFPVLALTAFVYQAKSQSIDYAKVARENLVKKKNLIERSWLMHIPFRSTGPTVMSGRVSDIAVNESNPACFYVAYASGGLWKTCSNGAEFESLFDHESTMTIGDIAVDWTHGETIWVGTGENNSSRSSYAGVGIYKSTNKGKSWQHLGLENTHHIGRIVLHPTNPDILWVAAVGALYTNTNDRGVYKTTDGGKTWQRTLFINDSTGAIDLTINPTNADILYAATWTRMRRAWHFNGSGIGSGIYKSVDGGENWVLVTTGKNGFPHHEGVGRIGLCVAPANPQVVYAVMDNQNRRKKEKKEQQDKLTKQQLRNMSKEIFLTLAEDKINDFLDDNYFPQKYNAAAIKSAIGKGILKASDLVAFLEDANALLFDTPVIGAEVYRSDNGGKSWQKTHDNYIDNLFYSYGYYFAQIRVSPKDENKIYTMGVPLIKSEDGGKTWSSIHRENTHADYHAMWVSAKNDGHLIVGNDGGINISYDDGKNYYKANNTAVGQFYAIAHDMEKPYNIYGGLQDNGVWYGKVTYEQNKSWHQSGQYLYKMIMGGDGMQVAIDSRDNNTVYTGYQFGNYFRINKKTDASKHITPQHELGEHPLRWNWQSPIHLSRHNQDILYMGSNKFHRSLNQGNDFKTLSGDLTKGGKNGNVPYATLTSIDESPKRFGLIYVGSDDGLVHVSKDGGYNWENITAGLPADLWVSRVIASAFEEARIYIALNGYRKDDFTPYLFVSQDFGASWQRLGTDLPHEPINVVKEDPKRENIIYVGTDHAVYVSYDKGKSFMAIGKNLPITPIHDLLIHPRENDLILGTHGRSIYIANISRLQALDDQITTKPLHVFDLDSVSFNQNWGRRERFHWLGYNEPNHQIDYFTSQPTKINVQVQFEGTKLYEQILTTHKGLNTWTYDLTYAEGAKKSFQKLLKKLKFEAKLSKAENGKHYLPAQTYQILFSLGEQTVAKYLTVKTPKKKTLRGIK